MTTLIINMPEYNQKEEDTFRKDLFRRMDVQDSTLTRIENQTIKTNGRVTVLEQTTKDYETYKAIVSALSGWKLWLTGGVTVILLGGAFVGNLLLKDIYRTAEDRNEIAFKEQKEEIANTVVNILEEKYNLDIK